MIRTRAGLVNRVAVLAIQVSLCAFAADEPASRSTGTDEGARGQAISGADIELLLEQARTASERYPRRTTEPLRYRTLRNWEEVESPIISERSLRDFLSKAPGLSYSTVPKECSIFSPYASVSERAVDLLRSKGETDADTGIINVTLTEQTAIAFRLVSDGRNVLLLQACIQNQEGTEETTRVVPVGGSAKNILGLVKNRLAKRYANVRGRIQLALAAVPDYGWVTKVSVTGPRRGLEYVFVGADGEIVLGADDGLLRVFNGLSKGGSVSIEEAVILVTSVRAGAAVVFRDWEKLSQYLERQMDPDFVALPKAPFKFRQGDGSICYVYYVWLDHLDGGHLERHRLVLDGGKARSFRSVVLQRNMRHFPRALLCDGNEGTIPFQFEEIGVAHEK